MIFLKLDFKRNLTLRDKFGLTKSSLKVKFDCTYLAPLKRVTKESNVVTHNAIRAGVFLWGMKIDAAEA